MNQTTHTSLLLIGLVVAFSAGVYVGRVQREPSAIPSNLDVASALTDAKAARQEAESYRAILTRTVEACRPEVRETH